MSVESKQPSVRADSVLEAALALASLGTPIIPVNGKIPMIKDWPANASTDPSQLRSWFGEVAP